MGFPEYFLQIATIQGVDQYIFVDDKGDIAAHAIKDPLKASAMVFSCCKNIQAVGKNRFKFALFSRENKKDLILFPLGNYYLGVVKKEKTEPLVLVELILRFIREIPDI
jgi:hypothetical protein